jgi:hypothetical protein
MAGINRRAVVMNEPHTKGVAKHLDFESCAGSREEPARQTAASPNSRPDNWTRRRAGSRTHPCARAPPWWWALESRHPFAVSSPEALKLEESRSFGSMARTSQSVTPFQCRHRSGAEGEPMAHHGPEVILHQPPLDQQAFGESAPDFIRRVRKLPFKR